jgi:amiloride-sensitive sodium channel subunit alpha/amiloride-sensitive sodium channel subunit gamma
LDSTGKTKSFKRLIERFAEKTSMQGVPYINSAKFWYAKLLWTILLLCCTAGMTLHLYYLINQFLQWPIQTKIELGFSNLNFPAVTLCNVNPIRNSKVYMASEHIQSLLAELETTSLYGDENAEVGMSTSFVGIYQI